MLKAIIFDLGKVLIPFDFKLGYAAMAPLCPYPAADIPKRIGTTDLVHRFECGMVEPRDFVQQLSALLELRIDYEKFCDIWRSIFSPEPLLPESMLQGLKKNYRLVLLSNTNAIHYEMLEKQYPMLRHFDSHVLSYRVKAIKPSPVIFGRAIQEARCLPGECFFTDDIAAYVEGAREFGIDAVQFESREQIERELKARGVSW